MDVDAVAVELYGLTPEQFTAARNAAAKDGGDASTGEAIKTLRKPTLAAWLANQLVRADPDGVNDLTELGEQLRQAHASGDGTQLRRLTPRRHSLVQRVVQTARDLAREQGRPVSEQITQRLTEALDAALVDPGAAQLLRSGQLTSALRHVGFGVVDETGEPAQLAPVTPRVVRSRPSRQPNERCCSLRADCWTELVLIDERDAAVGVPDAAEPPPALADPGIQLPHTLQPAIDQQRRVDPPDTGLIPRAVNGVLQLQIRSQRVRLDLGRASAAGARSSRCPTPCSRRPRRSVAH
ncbi:hypothetical protein [Kribbella sp. NPDC049227]|uniref:hypothetical protein n=1 Tax=Kribbella sp. NPDC049227 TaxID=3364113 RepID=UPI00372440C0